MALAAVIHAVGRFPRGEKNIERYKLRKQFINSPFFEVICDVMERDIPKFRKACLERIEIEYSYVRRFDLKLPALQGEMSCGYCGKEIIRTFVTRGIPRCYQCKMSYTQSRNRGVNL